MKELYSFTVTRPVEKEVTKTVKRKGEDVEVTKTVTEDVKERIVFVKPSAAEKEQAEFFYGQKYNEFINAGFLTRAMLRKKMGDLGGFASKVDSEDMGKMLLSHVEAVRKIEFLEGKANKSEEELSDLEEAKEQVVKTQQAIQEYEMGLNDQFSQTADTKADQKIIEWFVFNFAFYEDSKDDEKELFPIFKGSDFDEKRERYLQFCDEEDDESPRMRAIFSKSFQKLVQVAGVWYNGLASDQESIDKKLNELFSEQESD